VLIAQRIPRNITCRCYSPCTISSYRRLHATMVQGPPSPTSVLGVHTQLTPALGTLFTADTQLSALLDSPDALAELATTLAQRGVVFFPAQDLTIGQQKELGLRLGEHSGRPAGSGLHRHPISEDAPELGAETSVISSMGGIARARERPNVRASRGWHSDITFEPMPADFSVRSIHAMISTV
jgi:alpha-ketoglutarate-dependent taurine dioxygenase